MKVIAAKEVLFTAHDSRFAGMTGVAARGESKWLDMRRIFLASQPELPNNDVAVAGKFLT
jgi:hypothetical protein